MMQHTLDGGRIRLRGEAARATDEPIDTTKNHVVTMVSPGAMLIRRAFVLPKQYSNPETMDAMMDGLQIEFDGRKQGKLGYAHRNELWGNYDFVVARGGMHFYPGYLGFANFGTYKVLLREEEARGPEGFINRLARIRKRHFRTEELRWLEEFLFGSDPDILGEFVG